MKFKIGLTGSIGMGKSATAKIFARRGCSIWDADAAVHEMYGQGGSAVPMFQDLFPASIEDGIVSRARLRQMIQADPGLLPRIEQVVHPLVRQHREAFTKSHPTAIGVFDIPLLFETGSEAAFDATVCVHVDAKEQRRRVMQRGTMTPDQFEQVLAKQMPIQEKLNRATYRVLTDTPEHAEAQVVEILADVTKDMPHA